MDKASILIVEDEPTLAMYIEVILGHHGYCVSGIVSSGEAAVELATNTPPDLVLMDIKLMGNMTGIEAADKIMKSTGIPVIYVTAYANPSLMDEAMLTKPKDYIEKPFTSRRLIGAIENALNNDKMGNEGKDRRSSS